MTQQTTAGDSEDRDQSASASHVEGDLVNQLRKQVQDLQERVVIAEARVLTLLDAPGLIAIRIAVCDETGKIVHQRGFAEPALEDSGSSDRVGRAVHTALAQSLSSAIPIDQSIHLPGPPLRTMVVTGMPIHDEEGRPRGALAFVRDISEGHDMDWGLRDFVANLSHELKTPIGALGLLAETLLLEHDPVITERLVRRMHAESLRVGQVIDDLLNLSRIEGSSPTEFVTLSARSIVESAINRVRYTAEHRHIAIGVTGDIAATVHGTDRELVSAVHHLIENGLKYSSDNSSIDVSVKTDGSWTEISVSDHGVGIAPQYLDRIFERFYRVDDARTRTTGGTGLGLSIVHRVVHNHGGEVQVTSEEGKGSTFTLRLAARSSQDGVYPSGGKNG